MNIKLTRHAKEKMVILGISEGQIKRCLKQGSIQVQTDGYLSTHGYICVAWKPRNQGYKVKTVYLK